MAMTTSKEIETEQPAGSAIRTLIVDNDRAHALAVEEILERAGYKCDIATSGPEGLKRVQENVYDVVVTDLVMNDVDGMEILSRTKQLLPECEVVMVTGHASVPKAVEAMQQGAFNFLEKHISTSNRLRAVRTPMTNIKGYADLLLLGAAGPVNENQQRFLNLIKSNADRLSILVNDLLDISRIESGRVKLDIKPLLRAPRRSSAIVAACPDRRKAPDFAGELPEHGLPRVYADRDRLIQILMNLISNAHQYTPPGGVITMRVHQVGEFVQIDVSDTGIGIPPENQAKVFERFFRGDDPLVQEFSGTGLGLPIVKTHRR